MFFLFTLLFVKYDSWHLKQIIILHIQSKEKYDKICLYSNLSEQKEN